MSDYLFDGTGPVDPEVAHLEQVLRPFQRRPDRRPLGAALAVGVAVAAALLVWAWSGPVPWATETSTCSGCVWEEGAWLDTTTAARANLADRGELAASAGTRIRLDDADGVRLTVAQGEVSVAVAAPAGWLVVSLPGVDVVDLGCAYDLAVAADRTGWVEVTSGAVRLEGIGPSTYVHQGTMAATWPSGRSGMAVVRGATTDFVAAVDAFDRGLGPASEVLRLARVEDAVTLWHLLQRVPYASRPPIVAQLEQLVGALPVDATRLQDGEEEELNVVLAAIIGLTL